MDWISFLFGGTAGGILVGIVFYILAKRGQEEFKTDIKQIITDCLTPDERTYDLDKGLHYEPNFIDKINKIKAGIDKLRPHPYIKFRRTSP